MSKVEEVMAAVEPLVLHYQSAFGLSHWEVAYEVRESSGSGVPGSPYKTAARVMYDQLEERASVTFFADQTMNGSGGVKRVVRHEMLHIVAAPFMTFLRFIGRAMIPELAGGQVEMCIKSYEYFDEIMVRKLEIILDRVGPNWAKSKGKPKKAESPAAVMEWVNRIRDSLMFPLGLESWRIKFDVLALPVPELDVVKFTDPGSVSSPVKTIQPQYEQATLTLYASELKDDESATRAVRRALLRVVAAPFHTFATLIAAMIKFNPRQTDAYWDTFYSCERQLVRNIERLVVNSQS